MNRQWSHSRTGGWGGKGVGEAYTQRRRRRLSPVHDARAEDSQLIGQVVDEKLVQLLGGLCVAARRDTAPSPSPQVLQTKETRGVVGRALGEEWQWP